MDVFNNDIALVSNVLSHYRVPGFQQLARRCRDRITYYFLTEKMGHRNIVLSSKGHELNAVWLKGWKWRQPPLDDRHINNILPILRVNPGVIILGGWDEPSYFLLWAWGIIARKQTVLWIESTLAEGRRRGLKEAYKRWFLHHAAVILVPGTRSYEYCRALGVPAAKIFVAPNATDRDYFKSRAQSLLPQRQSLRRELQISEVAILFVGRLVEQYKHVSCLIKAYSRLRQAGRQVRLIIVGDGPDRDAYWQLVKRERVSGVLFMGEMGHERLCRVYAAADIMVLPSLCEPWGFVLNEAMEFGLPLVVSDAVGAGPDLVNPGENGFVVPAGDEAVLCQALEQLILDPELRQRMGSASRRIVEHFSPENWAAGVWHAIAAVASEARC
jgi:glycosyltransferase involved in cell wall biosynthesis